MLEHMDKEDNHDFPLLIKIARGEQVKNAHQVIESLVERSLKLDIY